MYALIQCRKPGLIRLQIALFVCLLSFSFFFSLSLCLFSLSLSLSLVSLWIFYFVLFLFVFTWMRAQQANPFHLPGSIMQIAVWSSLSADELQCSLWWQRERVRSREKWWKKGASVYVHVSKSLSLKATGVQVSTTTNKAKDISIW